ncbi:S1-C subfamily serine protease [Haloferula luteola]|uniref:S1-C subfamily serine protease n=1 Tax=Haloferula luteola TaxID=595692 RepID=A0A840V7V1_9BACT|nr:trypsin-like peptidase domain-containing protein [Haloferula luteola]MBB5349839.1 S1-C subfamily serine protease [Haloferula luteola]
MESLKPSLFDWETVMHKGTIPFLALILALPSPAARSLESAYRMGGKEMHRAFEPVQAFLQQGSAVIKRGFHEVIFGVVVSSDGYLLTKASELGEVGDLTITVDDQRYEKPVLAAVDTEWDVALLKVSATGWHPVDLSRTEDLERGEWIVANGATTRKYRRVQIGMVAANTREIPPSGGAVLGVMLEEEEEGLNLSSITEGSGAEKAGLQKGDRLLAIDGTEVNLREEVLSCLDTRRVGESVRLTILRGDEKIEVEVELAGRTDIFGESMTRNDQMSGDFSTRRTGFPRIMQHDIIGNRHFMGGPVLDLEGRCVGMNIARFSRCETYAIPARDLAELVDSLIKRSTMISAD